MFKTRKILTTFLIMLSLVVAMPVLAVSHRGGEWNYGGRHEVGNWGAFSNYYHRSKYHWSYVGSTARNRQKTAYAPAGKTSYASIHTNIGEKVVFDAGW